MWGKYVIDISGLSDDRKKEIRSIVKEIRDNNKNVTISLRNQKIVSSIDISSILATQEYAEGLQDTFGVTPGLVLVSQSEEFHEKWGVRRTPFKQRQSESKTASDAAKAKEKAAKAKEKERAKAKAAAQRARDTKKANASQANANKKSKTATSTSDSLDKLETRGYAWTELGDKNERKVLPFLGVIPKGEWQGPARIGIIRDGKNLYLGKHDG